MIDPFEKQYISVDEAAKILQVHKMTFYRWCQKHKIKCFKIGGQWRIPKDFVEKILKGGE